MSAVGAFRSACLVEAQLGLALVFVRTVTGETTIGEKRTDIAVEGDFPGLGNWRGADHDNKADFVSQGHCVEG